MKITIVTGFFLPIPPVRGGATEKIWDRLAQRFAQQGHEVTFLSRRWPGFPDREVIAGVRHLRVRGANHTRYLPLNLLYDFIWSLRVGLAAPSADICVCNSVALPAWLGSVKPRAGKVVAVVARMPKGQGLVYSRVSLILSLSAAVTAKLRSENPKLAARIRPFPFPIDWTLHAEAARARGPRSPVVQIGYIGRLNPEKGIALLLEAAERLAARADLPPWHLTLLGPISVPSGGGGEKWLAGLLEKHAATLRDRVTVLGPEFDPVKLAGRYASLDVFVYPSLAEKGETFGVAVAEAMAAGCAAVVSSLACFNEIVAPGGNGVVFEHAGAGADGRLADAIAGLLAAPETRLQLAQAGQASTRQFDYAVVAENVLADFQAVAPQTAIPE